MRTTIDTTLSELQPVLDRLSLPSETKLRITLEQNDPDWETRRRERAMEAMKKLRGSGNGKLLDALLEERARERTR
uniref:Uncharacterized protein n=1 Tax=Candidatus Kentrum sp. FM TaxID=2126340 RepID=A0A450TVV8_9GAMM|nr:MAG: hypothetical protein BECKFM1743A_GA0114220_100329 [Candidatus Kentron sp. FM]VFJ73059.1 MAG: hypothetical protein BECKFM1743C_GA0114222_106982 [Candidatus Kentron sp. FM]VFK06423.1 MAG: hypothetical protein BECKFM1743B_GA0114221_100175 [Candidatus Kentron sp. FM]